MAGQEELLPPSASARLGLINLALTSKVDGPSMKQLRADPTFAMISKHAMSILLISSISLLSICGVIGRIGAIFRASGHANALARENPRVV